MTDPAVPSKDALPNVELTLAQEDRAVAMANAMSMSYWGLRSAARVIVSLQDEVERFRNALTGISTCSTCEACRGAATRALGAQSTTPVARCEHGNPIDPTGGYVCLKCFRQPAGFCCDINASHPGKHRGGCPSETTGDGQ